MFENYSTPLLNRTRFLRRVLYYFFFSALVLFSSLALGVVGYHYFGELNWIDSLLNASMILTGMGPVNPMRNDVGKLFASFYALFSGLAFLTTQSILLAPLVHRFLHICRVDVSGD
ncbi:MAG: hypothetical protein MUE85_10455 [Microscillaceae bacterium]|jgi:hypothetical protein|nr:hypothetical protein [Microscillaceae bacterium]